MLLERRSGSSTVLASGHRWTMMNVVLAVMLSFVLTGMTKVEAATPSPTATTAPTPRYPTMSPVYQCDPAGLTKVGLQACQRGLSVKDYCLTVLFKVPHMAEPECEVYATKSPTKRPTFKKPTTWPTQSPQTKAEYELYRTSPPTHPETAVPTTKPPTYKGQTYSPTMSTKSPVSTHSPVKSTQGSNDTPSPTSASQAAQGGGSSATGVIAAILVILIVLVVVGLLYRRRQRRNRQRDKFNNLTGGEFGQGQDGGYAKAPRAADEIDIT